MFPVVMDVCIFYQASLAVSLIPTSLSLIKILIIGPIPVAFHIFFPTSAYPFLITLSECLHTRTLFYPSHILTQLLLSQHSCCQVVTANQGKVPLIILHQKIIKTLYCHVA